MAKQKIRRAINLNRQQPDPCARRLAYLANELTIAGAQVLKEDFGFDENQLNLWLDKMLYRVQKNRDEQQKPA